MIKARHTWFHVRFFRWYTNYRIDRNFSSVHIHGQLPDQSGKPLLVIGNHFSWWDGFFILWLNNRHLGRKFHVMMLEEQLRKNMILNKTGAFSIRRGSREMAESLGYAREILAGSLQPVSSPDTAGSKTPPLLLMYPQGKIQSQHTRPLTFEKGVERITRGLEGKLTILMVVVLTDYFSDQKPQLHFYLKEYPFESSLSVKELETAFNLFLDESARQQSGQESSGNAGEEPA